MKKFNRKPLYNEIYLKTYNGKIKTNFHHKKNIKRRLSMYLSNQ